ncbi:hypothetical protein C0J09_00440 [Bordetella avium]|uniref:hypothetical protein n=1 Tax=Bordetella avium TaxID=521 RepID=UPI000FDC42B4|nr:hypothetical protein [Bordetella avium]AZY47762.1 hypothetical protein C0J09_00440 [Bordetella avium]
MTRRISPKGCWNGLIMVCLIAAVMLPLVWFVKNSTFIYFSAVQRNQGSAPVLVPSTICRFGLVDYLSHLPPGETVLALRPSDMYYAKQRMISYLDPRLIPFYEADSKQEGLRILRALGIRYVQGIAYSLPVDYHSVLKDILADPEMASVVISTGREMLYELAPAAPMQFGPPEQVGPTVQTWSEGFALSLAPGVVVMRDEHEMAADFSPSGPVYPVFVRAQEFFQHNDGFIKIDPDYEYLITFKVEGTGFGSLMAVEYKEGRPPGDDPDRRVRLKVTLAQTHADNDSQTVTVRLTPFAGVNEIELGLLQLGGSRLRVLEVSMRKALRKMPLPPMHIDVAKAC